MKKCVIISNYVNNEYRRSLLKKQIELFNSYNIDVILVSSDPMEKYDGVKNYITNNHVCENQYLTEGIFPYFQIGNVQYYRNISNQKILYSNYFIKMYQTTLNYARNLGYKFCYFIEFDVILNKDHHKFIFNEVDLTKAYFYTLNVENNIYQTLFFHGNLDVLTSLFTDDKLKDIELLSKKELVISNEQIVYLLTRESKDVMPLSYTEDQIFEKRNLFSSMNDADIYYDATNCNYLFLCIKSDTCENEFSVELFEENNLIYFDKFTQYGIWYMMMLKKDTSYTVKCYDGEISNDALNKTFTVFTDSTKCATPNNWIKYIN